jgi:hypothetical protein
MEAPFEKEDGAVSIESFMLRVRAHVHRGRIPRHALWRTPRAHTSARSPAHLINRLHDDTGPRESGHFLESGRALRVWTQTFLF